MRTTLKAAVILAAVLMAAQAFASWLQVLAAEVFR